MTNVAPLSGHEAMADKIHRALKEAIFALELPQGAPLVERDLAARFRVSKSPVRDALQRLVGDGLVTQTAFKGMAVQVFSSEYVDELFALREVVEELSAREATPRFGDHDFESAHRELRLSEEAMTRSDYSEIARANQAFHLIISRASGNTPVHETLSRLQDRMRLISATAWSTGPSMAEEHAQHHSILEAMASRDADRAGSLMRAHVHASRIVRRETYRVDSLSS